MVGLAPGQPEWRVLVVEDAGEEKGWRSREAGWWGNNLDMNLTSEQVNGPILAG